VRDPQAQRHAARTAPTVADLCTRYLEELVPRLRPGSQREMRGCIATWILPALGGRRVADITRTDVEKLHATVSRRAPVRANRVASLLSRLMGLAIRWEMRSTNPVVGLQKNREYPRQRYLSGEELVRLTAVLRDWPDQTIANVVRLLLLTGARRGEVCAMKWQDLDLSAGTWRKPASKVKQDKVHLVPLSGPARQLIAELRAKSPTVGDFKSANFADFVFPARTAAGHIVDLKQWPRVRSAAGLVDFKLHDLRHSHASILASAGLSLPITGALLSHSQPSTTARYAHLLLDPLRQASETAGAVISGQASAEVVKIRG
jgi:integrase